MSLLGIDVGTTGCKSIVFSEDGKIIASAYEEYDIQRPKPGWAELDAAELWGKVKKTIKKVASESGSDPVRALSISSFAEAMVPVTEDRRILGPFITMMDSRGGEYLQDLRGSVTNERLYTINGNTIGNQYSITKLKWIKKNQSQIYGKAYKYLLCGSFVSFMLGADAVVDFSLANRTLLFDIDRADWSDEILKIAGLDRSKMCDTAPSGKMIGTVSGGVAKELGLPSGVAIVTGAHDQCANGVGCGVIKQGSVMYGMGTFICIMPVFTKRLETDVMIKYGLNTEHHAVPGQFVSFIYNQGGSMTKWFRDTFAAEEHRQAKEKGEDVYNRLMSEMPGWPSSVMVLPHFAQTGPPEFISDSSGVIAGLKLETKRGDILKGIIEGMTFYLKETVMSLPEIGIEINDYRAVGGGSKSEVWIQMCADIMGRPFIRPKITEAGALGAAIIAGMGKGTFNSYESAVKKMIKMDRTFEPNPKQVKLYEGQFEKYRQLWPTFKQYLKMYK